jgi:hypothetical protein
MPPYYIPYNDMIGKDTPLVVWCSGGVSSGKRVVDVCALLRDAEHFVERVSSIW